MPKNFNQPVPNVQGPTPYGTNVLNVYEVHCNKYLFLKDWELIFSFFNLQLKKEKDLNI